MTILNNLSQLLQKAKTQLKPVVANVERILNPVTEFTRANPLVTSIAAGAATGAGTSILISSVRKRSSKKSKRKRASTKRKRKSRSRTKTRRRKSKQKKPYTAGKRKDRSTRRIRYTKNNQPYIILKSGKARFIKKSSVARMRKRKGGKY